METSETVVRPAPSDPPPRYAGFALFSRKHGNGDQIDSELIRLLPQGGRIRGTLKGKIFRARVRPNGKIRFNGKSYSSLSVAAKAAIHRPTNGWWFWQVERGRHNWVRLNKVRKAGTPIYMR